jgi:hypothetical protein
MYWGVGVLKCWGTGVLMRCYLDWITTELPCCFLAPILYSIQDSFKEAAGKKG